MVKAANAGGRLATSLKGRLRDITQGYYSAYSNHLTCIQMNVESVLNGKKLEAVLPNIRYCFNYLKAIHNEQDLSKLKKNRDSSHYFAADFIFREFLVDAYSQFERQLSNPNVSDYTQTLKRLAEITSSIRGINTCCRRRECNITNVLNLLGEDVEINRKTPIGYDSEKKVAAVNVSSTPANFDAQQVLTEYATACA